jgi:hypothetical protein
MSADATPPPRPEHLGCGRLTQEEIEAQLRTAYGPKLEVCERLHAFGEDALYTWEGRPIDPESVDPIILAEGARATKTYGGTLRLLAGGFGPQASMLNRSLFEGMAIAHWAHTNANRAIELFKKHGRHSELLGGDAFEKADPADARVIDAGTEEERLEFTGLFGKYGAKLWTGHGSLYDLLPEIEEQWPEGPPREQLWWFFRVAHRDNNQVLHSTALGLSAGVTRTARVTSGRGSVEFLPRPGAARRVMVVRADAHPVVGSLCDSRSGKPRPNHEEHPRDIRRTERVGHSQIMS